MGYTRTQLVSVDASILSSYRKNGGTGGDRAGLYPLAQLKHACYVPQTVANALLAAHKVVTAAGGDFRVTDLYRSPAVQSSARKKYEAWLRAGKPSTRSPEWDGKTMKNAFVAKPGFSFHNAARSVDIDIGSLNFPVSPDKQLDTLWDAITPLGWRPVIRRPVEGARESWHFDFFGEWDSVFDLLGYKQTAMCACLDIGASSYDRWAWRFIQAQLHRAGHDVGDVDGYPGPRTFSGLNAAGIKCAEKVSESGLLAPVSALPTARYT